MSVSLFHERLIIMAKSNKNLHLTLSDRQIIQRGIENGATKASIAATLGKDKSTIGKEIKAHRKHTHVCSFNPACANKDRCKHHHVCDNCADLVVFKCKRRDRSPGACNGCSKFKHCRFDKFTYSADIANKEYEADLVNSREGINMTYSELKTLADIIVPLIKKGQSPYQIITSHPELNISEKTLYNYIESGVFRQFGLLDINLRVKTRRISKKDSVKYKKREDRKFLIGRTYNDFISYANEHDNNVSIVEMDTVYNGQSGPFMQTFKFLSYSFMFIIYHEEKTAKVMVEGVDLLETILGKDLFQKEVEVIKTDRGAEFSDAEGLEKDNDGNMRTHVFYCDAMQSCQKGSLENNHKEIRYICPKETALKELGFDSQEKANLMVSHINSQPKENLKGKSPLEMMEFLSPDLYKKFIEFGIKKIDNDEIILKPYLLKEDN